MLTHERLEVAGTYLDLKVAAGGRSAAGRTLILVHGLPRAAGMGRHAAGLLPELAEHLAAESGWRVATGTLSGVGGSTGTFSATRWRRDLGRVIDWADDGNARISLAGFGFGGALALAVAAGDERVRGAATFAAPAHLEAWCGSAESLHRRTIDAGVVSTTEDLPAADELLADVLAVAPLEAVTRIPPRRLLIGHGTDDVEVPVQDARDLVDAADGRAELRLIQGAGHQLRADPRMVATLLGWLDRHR